MKIDKIKMYRILLRIEKIGVPCSDDEIAELEGITRKQAADYFQYMSDEGYVELMDDVGDHIMVENLTSESRRLLDYVRDLLEELKSKW